MAEHDIEKIVEAGGEVFNFRDPTKQPVADRVTSIRAASSATDTKYPTEKAVADKLLDYALVKKTYGKQGYISYSAAEPDILVEKIKLGSLSLYNEGVTVKVYEFDEDDEENAVLVWDSSTLTGNELYQYRNGLQMSNIYFSPAGKWVKVSYTGSTSSYIRALGIFMTPKYADSSHVAFAKLRLNDAEYDWNRIATYGSLVTAVVTDSTKTTCDVIFKPESSAVRMRFFGFRCLNTYTGSDAVLLGRSTSALKLYTARKLKTNLARTSDSTFDGSADQLNIPVTGTLPVGNGGTGRTSVTAGNYVVGAGTSAMVEKTPKDVGSDVLSSLDNKSNASSYADFVDGDFVVGSDHVNASTISASTFVRRTALNLWNYIKSKLSGSDVNIGGNAATATKATQDSDGSAINTTYKKLAGSSKFTEPQWIDNNTRTSYNDLRIGNSSKLLSLGISGNGNLLLKELADGRTNSPNSEKSIIYTSNGGTDYFFNGKASTAGTADALADDSGYVHKAGSETVSGSKTFAAQWVMSFSSASTYSGFLAERVATSDSNHKYGISLEINDDGKRGVYDYGSPDGYAGEGKWVLQKDASGNIRVGESSNKVYISGKCFDFSGTIGSDANTFYLG